MNEVVEIGLPDKIEIHFHNDYMHIARKWFDWKIVLVAAFAVIWDFFIFGDFLSKNEETELLLGKLFLMTHFVVGVGITYYALAGLFNKTDIYVSREAIQIKHKPLPWLGNKRLIATELKQLYGKEVIRSHNFGNRVVYEVHTLISNGQNIKLLGGLETSEQALYIEQEIEKYLGIENIPFRGELG